MEVSGEGRGWTEWSRVPSGYTIPGAAGRFVCGGGWRVPPACSVGCVVDVAGGANTASRGVKGLGVTSDLQVVSASADLPVHKMGSSDSGSGVTDTSETDDNFTLIVNVTFNESTERFIFSCFDELSTLENEVAKRFKLECQGRCLKYNDEDNDVISIRCDDDLKMALDTLGRNNIVNFKYEKTDLDDLY
ncbi:hypothetical protein M8C21_029836 [Ambrosia artemisiifolia]|uniref:PB1 domain-containing protein n=1 Tax=Ambrosia artemisiifolia TaxID=4212 RepID=A0AAD5C295_AMBAR|nr:hypothetical protein M8C21_029836 [Ambrosia artemisiifolia]